VDKFFFELARVIPAGPRQEVRDSDHGSSNADTPVPTCRNAMAGDLLGDHVEARRYFPNKGQQLGFRYQARHRHANTATPVFVGCSLTTGRHGGSHIRIGHGSLAHAPEKPAEEGLMDALERTDDDVRQDARRAVRGRRTGTERRQAQRKARDAGAIAGWSATRGA
jgi:hypothetical protein